MNAAPTVTLGSFTNLCSNAAAITLADGSPTGGTFSGNGVSGTTFTPSVAGAGTTSITYSYTNAQGCTATANSPIEVDAAPSVTLSSITPLCINSPAITSVSYTHLRAHETVLDLVCRLLLEKKKYQHNK